MAIFKPANNDTFPFGDFNQVMHKITQINFVRRLVMRDILSLLEVNRTQKILDPKNADGGAVYMKIYVIEMKSAVGIFLSLKLSH